MVWILVALFVVLCVALVFLILKLKAHNDEKVTPSATILKPMPVVQEHKIPTIDTLLAIALNAASNKDTLFNACRIFTEKLAIPEKKGSEVSNEAKKYLNFITLIASHKNVDAKLILFLGTNSKKKNPAYEREIEASEAEGINKRKNGK